MLTCSFMDGSYGIIANMWRDVGLVWNDDGDWKQPFQIPSCQSCCIGAIVTFQKLIQCPFL